MWTMIERFADAHLGIRLEVFAGSSELASLEHSYFDADRLQDTNRQHSIKMYWQ